MNFALHVMADGPEENGSEVVAAFVLIRKPSGAYVVIGGKASTAHEGSNEEIGLLTAKLLNETVLNKAVPQGGVS